MQRQINNQIMHAGKICFNDGSVLEDRIIYMINGFVVVATDQDDSHPDWYNLSTVSSMHDVYVENTGTKSSGRIGVW